MKRYVFGYIKNSLNLQISVSVYSIEGSIDGEQSDIKLSYKGGREALGKETSLQGGHSLLPVVASKQGVVASFQQQLIKQGVIASFQQLLVNRVQYHPCLQQQEKTICKYNFAVIGSIDGLPNQDSMINICSVCFC